MPALGGECLRIIKSHVCFAIRAGAMSEAPTPESGHAGEGGATGKDERDRRPENVDPADDTLPGLDCDTDGEDDVDDILNSGSDEEAVWGKRSAGLCKLRKDIRELRFIADGAGEFMDETLQRQWHSDALATYHSYVKGMPMDIAALHRDSEGVCDMRRKSLLGCFSFCVRMNSLVVLVQV